MTPASWIKCRASIMRHEGYAQLLYKDSKGYDTIGYGHKITSKTAHLFSISMDDALVLLQQDMESIQSELCNLLPLYDLLDDPRQAVLLEMAFNLGVAGLLQFRKMLRAVADKNYLLAGQEMLDSLWHEQVGNRADDLEHVMVSGVLA